MSEENSTVNIKNKNAMCYVPLAAFFINSTETKKTGELKKHIKYGILIFIIFLISSIAFSWLLGGILFLLYLGLSGFLGFKAYSGDKIDIAFLNDIDFLDNFINKESKNNNEKDSSEKKDSSKKDDDPLNF